MTDDIKLWMLTLLGTLTVVKFTAWLNTLASRPKLSFRASPARGQVPFLLWHRFLYIALC